MDKAAQEMVLADRLSGEGTVDALIGVVVLIAGVAVIWWSIRLLILAFGAAGAIKREGYSAVVAEKLVQRSEDGDWPDRHVLRLKTSEGDIKLVAIGQRLWESCEIGDQLIKQPGKMLPQKV
jgi:hypothetical protein